MSDRSSSPFAMLAPIVAALAAVCVAAGSVRALPAESSPAAVKHGAAIFHQRCIVCHNKKPGDTTPFGPPNLFEVFGKRPPLLTAQQAEEIITHGKGQMPSFSGVLTRADMGDVLAYLRPEAAAKK